MGALTISNRTLRLWAMPCLTGIAIILCSFGVHISTAVVCVWSSPSRSQQPPRLSTSCAYTEGLPWWLGDIGCCRLAACFRDEQPTQCSQCGRKRHTQVILVSSLSFADSCTSQQQSPAGPGRYRVFASQGSSLQAQTDGSELALTGFRGGLTFLLPQPALPSPMLSEAPWKSFHGDRRKKNNSCTTVYFFWYLDNPRNCSHLKKKKTLCFTSLINYFFQETKFPLHFIYWICSSKFHLWQLQWLLQFSLQRAFITKACGGIFITG